MKSKILQEILDETPKEVEEFVMEYGDSLVTNYQKQIIDKLDLKGYKKSVNEDMDIILYKEIEDGLHSWIIHTEDEYAYSFIGNEKGNILEYFK